MNVKRIAALCLAALLSVGVLSLPGTMVSAEENTLSLSTDNMSISWDESGTISSVVLQGKEMISNSASGFVITDAASGQDYAFQAPVVGGTQKKQSGTVSDTGLKMEVTYRQEGHAIYVDGTITDTTKTDRLVRVEYLLPVSAEGLYWYDDISTKKQVKLGTYNMPVDYSLSGHKMSLYPYGAVSNGQQAVAMGVPMDPPQSYLIGYKNSGDVQAMSMKFNFALTPKTKKIVSKADFSFVIYAPTQPEWGFRSASQDYYDLFPEYFEVKSQGGGNWLFQHAYELVEGVEDFYFGYNETPGSYKFDEENGVTSLQYTAPAEQWMMWPGMPKEPEPTYEQYLGRFNDLLSDTTNTPDISFPAVSQKNVAEAMKNSAVLLESGKYHTAGWYAYDVSVCFVTNHNPDLPGWNSFKLQISQVERAEKAAKEEGTTLGGVYIDNLAGLGSFNYREEHFETSDMNLLWNIYNNRLVLPSYSSMYSYTKGIRERCDEKNQIIFANMVFPERGITQYIHMVDVPGSECGPHWGWDPYIQRLRRTMTYRKPWMLLLGHDLGNTGNWGASVATYDQREAIMKSSIAYGLFANVIGYRVDLKEYEKARPLFRKYTYIAVMQDKLGWNPITYAAPSNNTGYIDSERFGDLGTGAAIFTAYNTTKEVGVYEGSLDIDLKAMNVSDDRAATLMAFDLVDNVIVPVTVKGGKLSYDLSLRKEGLSAVIVGTKEEIWAMLFERIKSTIQRGDDATTEIPDELYKLYDIVPSQWEEIMTHINAVVPIKDMDAAAAMKKLGTLTSAMKAIVPLAEAAIDEMYNCQELLEIDVLNIFSDAYAIVVGLFGENVSDVVDDNAGKADGANNTIIIIVCVVAVILVAAGGVVTALLLTKKKKRGSMK